jgi:hypothetical protein
MIKDTASAEDTLRAIIKVSFSFYGPVKCVHHGQDNAIKQF